MKIQLLLLNVATPMKTELDRHICAKENTDYKLAGSN